MPEKMKRVLRLACPLLQTRRKSSAQHDLDLKLPKLPNDTSILLRGRAIMRDTWT